MFKVGDEVEWESQAMGIVRLKRGTVVEVVPEGAFPKNYRVGDGMERRHISYVVRAVALGRSNPKRKSTYWPRVSALRPAGPEGERT